MNFSSFHRLFLVASTLVLAYINSYSQDTNIVAWAPIGAQWHYQLRLELGNYLTWVKLESKRDSIIGDDTLRVVQVTASYDEFGRVPSGDFMLKQEERSLFYFMNDSLHLLYDFNADIGDTLILRSPTDLVTTVTSAVPAFTHDTVLIKGISTININGVDRTIQKVESIRSIPSDYGPTLVEGLGSLEQWLFPTFISAIEDMDIFDGLRCYSDSMLGLISFVEVPCDYDNTNVSSKDIISTPLVSVYPNPASTYLIVKQHNPHATSISYSISDLSGHLLQTGTLGTETRISLPNNTPLIVLNLTDSYHKLIFQKLIYRH